MPSATEASIPHVPPPRDPGPPPGPGRRAFLATTTVTVLAAGPAGEAVAQARGAGGGRMKDVRFVVFHRPGPAWLPGKTLFDQPGVMAHVAHYRQLLDAGKLALGGPHLDDGGGGMMIPAAGVPQAEIEAFAARDPAVVAGVLRFEVRPWLVGLSA